MSEKWWKAFVSQGTVEATLRRPSPADKRAQKDEGAAAAAAFLGHYRRDGVTNRWLLRAIKLRDANA